MKVYFPAYYQAFRCISSACPDSCCKEWTVDVDAHSASAYRSLSGELGDRLRAVLEDTEDGTIMKIENGRCPMWREDGLCRIQAELGHDALCQTCREYPRLRHDYGNFVELGLELSCPEAARLIFTGPQNILTEDQPDVSTPDYDPFAMKILIHSRRTALDFLENDNYTLPEKLAVLLLYGYDIQAQIDGDTEIPFTPEMLLAEGKRYAKHGDLDCIFTFFRNLEILTDRWPLRLQKIPEKIIWSESLVAFVRYLIQRYWLQAVSDLDLVCRIKFLISACLLIGALGGDLAQTTQLFSKEIENNPDNIAAILDGAYSAPALTDTNLLSVLLG